MKGEKDVTKAMLEQAVEVIRKRVEENLAALSAPGTDK